MDDVMADTSRYLYHILRARHPDVVEFQHDRTHFDIRDEYKPQHLAIVESVLYSPDFQLSIPPIPGSLEAVAEIESRGHKVKFCSTPHRKFETCVLQKYLWLERNLGRNHATDLILTKDKTCEYAQLLIDDKPEITGDLDIPFWEHILFTASYNIHVVGRRRLDSWNHWRAVLSEL